MLFLQYSSPFGLYFWNFYGEVVICLALAFLLYCSVSLFCSIDFSFQLFYHFILFALFHLILFSFLFKILCSGYFLIVSCPGFMDVSSSHVSFKMVIIGLIGFSFLHCLHLPSESSISIFLGPSLSHWSLPQITHSPVLSLYLGQGPATLTGSFPWRFQGLVGSTRRSLDFWFPES